MKIGAASEAASAADNPDQAQNSRNSSEDTDAEGDKLDTSGYKAVLKNDLMKGNSVEILCNEISRAGLLSTGYQ